MGLLVGDYNLGIYRQIEKAIRDKREITWLELLFDAASSFPVARNYGAAPSMDPRLP